ncbi:MAG TPA: MerR family transcriptional regulator [Candidatus Hydrogenedentes bacterium]|nr:MerR family transcriptional regulator [Candidatus Hydrogenedentota bacterium]HOL75495.1 MerR family transcriptional regulator [Candidatus Hydrogenedentota bacterium]HPO86063.1 MerR family transcriptional regulator [Candidatus Hydrogenedentota bacterium]
MILSQEKRYRISEVSKITDVPQYVLRQWEERFEHIKPKRDRAGRRYYTAKDVELILEIRRLLWQEGLTSEGVRKLLKTGRRRVDQLEIRTEIVNLIDEIERDVRRLIDLADSH